MSEKMKLPHRSQESVPEFEAPPSAEQDILETLHAEAERHGNGHHSKEGLGKLHKDIERCHCYPIFKQYVSGEIPTLERMFQNVKPLIAEMDKEIDSERAWVAQGEHAGLLQHLEKSRGLLLGRESQIRGAIQRYVNSVIRFNRLNKLRAGGARDVSKQFEEADHARRRAHNSLLESLATYAAIVKEMREEGASTDVYAHFKFQPWESATDARRIPGDTTVFFAPDVVKNRDFIRDWAIVADFHEQLRILGDDEWIKTNGDH